MKGYIKVHRKVRKSSIWVDPFKFKLWMLCLMKATHSGGEMLIGNQIIKLEIGQFPTGREALEKEFNEGVTKKNFVTGLTLFRWLDLFEKMEMLNIKKTNKYTIVTINNWDKYQVDEQQANNSCTSDEQQMFTSKKVLRMNKNDNKGLENEEDVNQIKDEPQPKEKAPTVTTTIKSFTNNEELRQALKDYLEMRRKINKPVVTVRTITDRLNELSKLSEDAQIQIAIVNQSVDNSWQRFYKLKNKKKEYDNYERF